MKERQRENWIDLVKCIAILIVVMNHAAWIIPGVNFLGGMFYVPVFFILSGYTWKDKGQKLGQVFGQKAKRLLVPYAGANAFLCLFFVLKDRLYLPGNRNVLFLKIAGVFYARNQLFVTDADTLLASSKENTFFLTCLNSPTWFLPALFVTLLGFEVLYRVAKKDEKKIGLFVGIGFLFATLYHYLCPLLLPWSLDAVPFFLLMFYVGYFIKVHHVLEICTKKPIWLLASICFFVIGAWLNKSTNFSIAFYGKSVVLAVLNAIVSSVLLMWICKALTRKSKAIPFVMGHYTLTILCYHLFVLAVLDFVFSSLWPVIKVLLTITILTVLAFGADKMKQRAGKQDAKRA